MSAEATPTTTTIATAEQLIQLKREDEIQKISGNQHRSLIIFEETEQSLDAFNRFSQARYQNVHKQFEMHTRLLKDVKDDLNSVFRKINTIKQQLASKYSSEMAKALELYPPKVVAEDEELDEEAS